MQISQAEGLAQQFSRQSEFIAGARATIPLIIGAIPFGMIYGAVAATAGLSPAATIAMSVFVFAGSAQFIAAGLVAQGVGVAFIVLTTFIVNLRHALYGASLGPYMKHLPQRWLLPLAFWLTDESYAIVIRRYPAADGSPYKHWFNLGSALAMYSNWILCTIVGIIAGTQMEGIADWGLDFAMVVTFIGIVVPMITRRAMLICALVAGITALLVYSLPNQSGLMVAAFAGIVAGLIAEQAEPKTQALPKQEAAS